jgi:hypothetical protein
MYARLLRGMAFAERSSSMLFDDEDKVTAEALRDSVVSQARRSQKAKSKVLHKRTEDGLPVHSFQTCSKT